MKPHDIKEIMLLLEGWLVIAVYTWIFIDHFKRKKIGSKEVKHDFSADEVKRLVEEMPTSPVTPTDLTPNSISSQDAENIGLRAVKLVIDFERRSSWQVEDVSMYTCGYDLKSTRGHDFKAIEVKGKLTSGQITITANEWRAASRMGESYHLYVVENLSSKTPTLKIVQDPAKALQPEQSKMQFVLARSAYISADQIIELASGVNSI